MSPAASFGPDEKPAMFFGKARAGCGAGPTEHGVGISTACPFVSAIHHLVSVSQQTHMVENYSDGTYNDLCILHTFGVNMTHIVYFSLIRT